MKILAISGAHRNSNIEALLSELLKGCVDGGAEVETLIIREKNIAPCCGWSDCYYENYCRVNDEMQEVYSRLEGADAWILATPVYFDMVSSYTKIFMDRLNPYCKLPRYNGKKLFAISVGGASKRSIRKCSSYIKKSFVYHMQLNLVGSLMFVADKENEILGKKKELRRAYLAGKKFALSLRK